MFEGEKEILKSEQYGSEEEGLRRSTIVKQQNRRRIRKLIIPEAKREEEEARGKTRAPSVLLSSEELTNIDVYGTPFVIWLLATS